MIPEIESRAAEIEHGNNQTQPAETQVRTRTVAVGKRAVSAAANEPLLFSETDFQLACAALSDQHEAVVHSGRRLAEALVGRAKKASSRPGLARVRAELAEALARGQGAPNVLESTNLAWWHPANAGFGYQTTGGWSPNYWTAQDSVVAHLAGSDVDFLLFDYPLTGTFEFSVEAFDGPWAESALTHNGLLLEPSSFQGNSQISQVGDLQSVNLPSRLSRRDGFNRMTVQVSPGRVRYLVNGHLYFEDEDPGPTAPWLGLFTHRDRHAVWRGLTLSGEPTIPRELKLCEGSRLDGWITSFYNESVPGRLWATMIDPYGNRVNNRAGSRGGVPNRRTRSSERKAEPADLDAFDWSASYGVIHGRRIFADTQRARAMQDGSISEADQSRLCYFRPLHDGDVLSYEFLYEPDQVMVHPALDRLVFLVEPGGVRLHWMTEDSYSDLSGLPADNTAEEPQNRRGPKVLPLKRGDWNRLALAIEAGKATLELNGQTIYEQPLEAGLSRQFSFFHFKDHTAARARNVVLRGRWPQALSSAQKANLASSGGAGDSVAERRARRALIDESIYALEAGAVLAEARKLTSNDRYERLAAWVLAAPDRPVWRLSGESSASFPAPPCEKEAPSANATAVNGASSAGATRLETGGEITAPALELVATARATGKLDELAGRVRSVQAEGGTESPEFERGRLVLLGLIQIAQGDDTLAAKTIAAIQAPLKKLDAEAPVYARWPELLLASRAIERSALRIQAAQMMDIPVQQTVARRRANGPYESLTRVWDQVLFRERAARTCWRSPKRTRTRVGHRRPFRGRFRAGCV